MKVLLSFSRAPKILPRYRETMLLWMNLMSLYLDFSLDLVFSSVSVVIYIVTFFSKTFITSVKSIVACCCMICLIENRKRFGKPFFFILAHR